MMSSRFGLLPDRGSLLVSADLHGNGADFDELSKIFDRLAAAGEAHWVLLGDLVHAPDPFSRARHPELYGFEDESWRIVEGVADLKARYPGSVHLLLGNHDYGHIGGPRPSKFYLDEVRHLEEQLTAPQIALMHELFEDAALVMAAPCGVLLAHGAPGDALKHPSDLECVAYSGPSAPTALLQEILTSYGQPAAVCANLLRRMSEALGFEVSVLIHGHDRCETGWFTEGDQQIEAVLFGAPRHAKRYLLLDLAARYRSVRDLRDGAELRRLYE